MTGMPLGDTRQHCAGGHAEHSRRRLVPGTAGEARELGHAAMARGRGEPATLHLYGKRRSALRPQDGPRELHGRDARRSTHGSATAAPRCCHMATAHDARSQPGQAATPPNPAKAPPIALPRQRRADRACGGAARRRRSRRVSRRRRSMASAATPRTPDAVARIYAAKGRPANHPVIVHLAPQGDPDYWVDALAARGAASDRRLLAGAAHADSEARRAHPGGRQRRAGFRWLALSVASRGAGAAAKRSARCAAGTAAWRRPRRIVLGT